ncbi:glycerophosphodiester phosphodiesterase [Steroidobacter sp. S1-65]|uniref:glycerophosphodiester phosphodiesterase n=1 Tax=Steroidobacter gossypii TaxID=2805490 RepID=A0ABS1WTE3_9GAMM|nr:glycerophosphodiester phosphodiesterase [Steroidobacter gossypii]MBM0104246.1 glycerophosphodiester phosphodiesterase [Steroidobacter gossypii]
MTALGFVLAMVLTMGDSTHAQASADKKWGTLDGAPPLVIAHRGASGYRPEHTLASYLLAIEFGADYIEPDLVATRDGHLIARHEPLLDDTTDVKSRPEFAARRSTKTLDGKQVAGFYASDFTLAEIRELRAVQANPARSKEYDGMYTVPTFEEILDLVERESTRRGRPIGIYPETKHPAFHLALQLPLEDRLIDALNRRNLNRAGTPIFIQSFESANLQYLRSKTELPLVQLMDEGSLIYDASGKRVVGVHIPDYGDPRGGERPSSLTEVASYAYAIGPWKRQILRDVGQPKLLTTTAIEQAHAAGLRVHTYTFRDEPATLAPEYENDPLNEYRRFFELGVDGVFSDFSDTALKARAQWQSR